MPVTLPAYEDGLNAQLPDGAYQVMLLDVLGLTIGFTTTDVTAGSADINITGNNLVVNSLVRFATLGTLPNPLAANTAYRVVNKGPGDLIQVGRIPGAAPLAMNDVGSGDHSLAYVEPVELVDTETVVAYDLDDLLRYEVAAYPNNLRPTVNLAGVTTKADSKCKDVAIAIDNSAGTGTLEFTHLALLLGGSTTPGDVTGVARAVVAANPSPVQIPAAEQRIVTISIKNGPC